MLPGGQPGGGPPPGREARAGAPGPLRRLPAPRRHDTGQIEAVDGHVLGGADARTVPGNPLHHRRGEPSSLRPLREEARATASAESRARTRPLW